MVQSVSRKQRAATVLMHPAASGVMRSSNTTRIRRIAFPTAEGVRFVRTTDIEFCRAEGNYCHIQLDTDESILLAKTLKWVEARLPHREFIRVHASYIIAKDKVEMLTREQLTMRQGAVIPVSRGRRNEVRDLILQGVIV